MANELLSWLKANSTATIAEPTTGTPATHQENTTRTYNTSYSIDDHYSDDNFSTINTLKVVTIDSSQINLTQEQNSQVIPFKLPRYYDGIDLNDMTFLIHYRNANSEDGVSTPINVYYDDDYIYFYWLVDEYVTTAAGSITFEIVATGVHNERTYVWRTRPNTQLVVLAGMDIVNSNLNAKDTWDKYIAQLSGTINSITTNMKDSADRVLTDELKANYYTKTETDTAISNAFSTMDIYVASATVEDGYIVLTFNSNGSTLAPIKIAVSDIISGLATTTYLSENYYDKTQIGDWTSSSPADGTLVKYIKEQTSDNYALQSYVGELPDNTQEGIDTVTGYIGSMKDAFYSWVIDLQADNPLTYGDDKYNFYTYSADGSEFFTSLIAIDGLQFDLYEDIELDQTGLDNDSLISSVVGNLKGVNAIYEKSDDTAAKSANLKELFGISILDSTTLIANYSNFQSKFNNHYLLANLHESLNLENAPDAEVFYRVIAPTTISSSSTSDVIRLIQVPVRKQFYSSAPTVVEYVNNLEKEINTEVTRATNKDTQLQSLIDQLTTDLANCYTKEESDTTTEEIRDYVTETVNDMADVIGYNEMPETGYDTLFAYIKSLIDGVDSNLSNYKTEVSDTYLTKTDASATYETLTDAATHATKEYVGTIPEDATSTNVVSYISELIAAEDITGKLTNYATKEYVDNAVANLDIISDSDLLDYLKQEE